MITNSLVAILGALAIVSYFLFLAWTVIDALKERKFWWVLFILCLPFVGAVVYFFVEKEHDYMKISEE